MGRKFSGDDGAINSINIVPFVDVILVLLVILMMTAPSLYQSSVRIDLPAAFNPQRSDKITLRVMMSANGDILLDRRKVKLEELVGFYQQAVKLDPEVDAVIEADKSLSHGAVMRVVDVFRKGGMKHIAIGTAG